MNMLFYLKIFNNQIFQEYLTKPNIYLDYSKNAQVEYQVYFKG